MTIELTNKGFPRSFHFSMGASIGCEDYKLIAGQNIPFIVQWHVHCVESFMRALTTDTVSQPVTTCIDIKCHV